MTTGGRAAVADADVIVVGAGPAGCAAAIVLARAGVRVRLLDRASFPRDKLCGDTVNPGAFAVLARLGIAETVRARSEAVAGMIISGPGACVRATYPGGLRGAALRRRELDLLLVEAAAAAGASFHPGVRVFAPVIDRGRVGGVRIACAGGERTLRARLVIAADGRASRLASALRLSRFASTRRRWAFGAYFAGVDGLAGYGEMHIRAGGYIGVAPLPGGIANVCVVRDSAGPAAALRAGQDAIVGQTVACDPMLRERFAQARQISPVVALGPLAVDSTSAGCPGLLLAGDAGGFVDPMTGDGLRFALRGGELAAAAALGELARGTAAHVDLRAVRRREFAGKWRLNRILRAFVGSPHAVAAGAALARHWQAPFEYLVAMAGDVRQARREGPIPEP